MKKTLYILLAMAVTFVSCEKELTIGSVDESSYDNVSVAYGYVKDANSGKISTVVELYTDDYETAVNFNLARVPSEGVDIVISYDESYVSTYNNAHDTEFEAYPSSGVTLGNNGEIVMAPDETTSYSISLTIAPLDTATYEAGATYLLPLKATTTTSGVTLSDEQCVYLVKNYYAASSAIRYDGEKSVFAYLECGDTNPLNVLQWQMEDGRYLTDFVCLFAANINYDSDAGELYIYTNDEITYMLENYDLILKPLKDAGIKIILGLLGNHDESGLAQLSELGAKDFAKKIAAMCYAYDFDGVNFDDEYSDDPDLTNPLFTSWSRAAGSRLMYETKVAMPDKYVTTFQYSGCYGTADVDGVDADEWLDIVLANYGSKGVPLGSMSYAKCSGASKEMNYYSISVSEAQTVANGDYGYFMIFAPWASSYVGSSKHFGYLNNLAQGLYGYELVEPEYYYPSPLSLETSEY